MSLAASVWYKKKQEIAYVAGNDKNNICEECLG